MLILEIQSFVLKVGLDTTFYLGSTENTTTEPGVNAVIVPQIVGQGGEELVIWIHDFLGWH
jgi:hypothetical protein